jgi:hypothetical protein
MSSLRRHWYNLGLVLGAIAIAWALLGGLSTVQMILLLNFAALTLHQFEEYGWPGGFPWIHNQVVMASPGPVDRFPLNQNSSTFVNVGGWLFCLAPAMFPDQRGLGLAMVLFTLGQLVYHGIISNRKLKSLYNPGLAAVVLLHIPLGIWYLSEVFANRGFSLGDCVLAVIYLGSFMGVWMQLIAFRLLASRDSPYPFAPEEMERFDRRRHLARLGVPGEEFR